jgi:hypothetical protein
MRAMGDTDDLPIPDDIGGLYILDANGEPVLCKNIREWGDGMQQVGRTLACETVAGFDVSTVFLGIDHSFHGGPPVLWETMIFDKERNTAFDGYQKRYTSRAAALAGHAEAVRMVLRATVQA